MAHYLKDHPFNEVFYWKGKRYKKFFELKDPKKCTDICCYEHPQGEPVNMPARRKVKQVVRI